MSLLKNIPKVDKILEWPAIIAQLSYHPRDLVMQAIRTALDSLRTDIKQGRATDDALSESPIVNRINEALSTLNSPSLKRVINGTGVVIHTNLGRSPLPIMTREALCDIATGYSNLEYDLVYGERGSRNSHVEDLICELTGAEAALVVNNNAAAVLLALSSLSSGRETVVSRGELVEIGGSFRIPDVMKQSGAILREVGTTNRTHPADYLAAITSDTGLLLKVHCSNFAVLGFTAEVSAEKLVELGLKASIPVMVDAGSGSLISLSALLDCNEPTIKEYMQAGVDITTFSGDKLLGGPQAGLIVGRKTLIDPMRKHPLQRALRIDKLSLAVLESTLRIYRDERRALTEIPTLRMLTATLSELTPRARRIVATLRRRLPATVSLTLMSGLSQAGGGSLPLVELPTMLIAVETTTMPPQEIASALRNMPVPVIGRVAKGRFILDVRTLLDEDIPHLTDSLCAMIP